VSVTKALENVSYPVDSAKSGRLESIAKFASTSPPKSTEIYTFSPPSAHPEIMRFYLQSLARELLPKERVALCLRRIVPTQQFVEIWKSDATSRAYYKNLMTCDSIWNCPICAAKISELRRQELTAALNASDYHAVMVTFTLRHSHTDRLVDLVRAITEAHRAFKSGRWFKEICEEYGWKHSVKANEVTHGQNGWHPHIHELALFERKLTTGQLAALERELKAKWGALLLKQGYNANWEHGLDVEARDENIRDYVAKFGKEPAVAPDASKPNGWTLEHELTKATVKKAKGKNGRTPMQMLWDYGDGDIKAGRLWQEYAKTFKGKPQLRWSPGMRDTLKLGAEAADEELNAQDEPAARLLARLDKFQYMGILKGDIQGETLVAARTLSEDDFNLWLADKLEKWATFDQ